MAKVSFDDISTQQLNVERMYKLNNYDELLSARQMVFLWKKKNNKGAITRSEESEDGSYKLYVTIYDKPGTEGRNS